MSPVLVAGEAHLVQAVEGWKFTAKVNFTLNQTPLDHASRTHLQPSLHCFHESSLRFHFDLNNPR